MKIILHTYKTKDHRLLCFIANVRGKDNFMIHYHNFTGKTALVNRCLISRIKGDLVQNEWFAFRGECFVVIF